MAGNKFSGSRSKPDASTPLSLPVGEPPIPENVSADDRALAHWQAICEDLGHRGCLSPSFGYVIERASLTQAHLDRIERELRESGFQYTEQVSVRGGGSNVRRSALITTQMDLTAKLVPLLDRLGMTPAYASKMPGQQGPSVDPDFLPVV